MKLTCKISGLSWQPPGAERLNRQLVTIHPIVALSPSELLTLASPTNWNKLSKQDKRLLALALFNCTRLVQWDSPASTIPNHLGQQESTIAKVIPSLIEIIDFMTCRYPNGLASQSDYFPRIIVTENNNRDMSIMLTACELWQAVIEDYHQQYALDYLSRKESQKRNFLSHLKAFNSRKPSRYIERLSHYVIECLPADIFEDREAREYYRYIIEFSGINRTIESNPTVEIMRSDVEWLIDQILAECDIDNQYIWQAQASLRHMLDTGGYNTYGGSVLGHSEAHKAQEQDYRAQAIAELGIRPTEFLAAIRYDAAVIKRIEELKTSGAAAP